LPSGYHYQDHQSTVNILMECWLSDTDTRLIAIAQSDATFALVLQMNPSWFVQLGFMDEARWTVFGVFAPQPTAAQCQAARLAT
jgi:hypothetical protein